MKASGLTRVLLIAGDRDLTETARRSLPADRYKLQIEADYASGLTALATVEPHVMMVEPNLPGHDLDWLVRRIRDDVEQTARRYSALSRLQRR